MSDQTYLKKLAGLSAGADFDSMVGGANQFQQSEIARELAPATGSSDAGGSSEAPLRTASVAEDVDQLDRAELAPNLVVLPEVTDESPEEAIPSADATDVREMLYSVMRSEWEAYSARLAATSNEVAESAQPAALRCLMCPFWRAPCWTGLRRHVDQAHAVPRVHMASGTKQLNVLYALHDSRQFAGQSCATPIQESAVFLAETLGASLPHKATHIDRRIVLLLTSQGPRYIAVSLVANLTLRRVGYTYYDCSFADLLSRESAWCHGRVRTLMSRVCLHWTTQGSRCVSLIPQTVETWLRLLEDIWGSLFLHRHRTNLLSDCERREEYRHVSIDCTLRVLRRVRGQADYRASAAVRHLYPIPDEQAVRKVLTVIGTAGGLLGLGMVPEENQAQVAASLQKIWTVSQLAQVQTVSSDDPSGALYKVFRINVYASLHASTCLLPCVVHYRSQPHS